VCLADAIITGKTATTFEPYSTVTRLPTKTMVVRMAYDLRPAALSQPPAGWTGGVAWTSGSNHDENAAQAEWKVVQVGLDLAALSSTGYMTRGEAAQVLFNVYRTFYGVPAGSDGPKQARLGTPRVIWHIALPPPD